MTCAKGLGCYRLQSRPKPTRSGLEVEAEFDFQGLFSCCRWNSAIGVCFNCRSGLIGSGFLPLAPIGCVAFFLGHPVVGFN